jgi:hypothetical protein
MGRARLIRGGKALNNRYVSSNAGFYDRVAFEKIVRDRSEPAGGFEQSTKKRAKKKTKSGWKKRRSEPKTKSHSCPTCGKRFATEVGMRRHDEDVHRKAAVRMASRAREIGAKPLRRTAAEPNLGIVRFRKIQAEMIAAGLIPSVSDGNQA